MSKFGLGKHAFAKFEIELEQIVIEIDEIQGENPELIIRDKARRAFELTHKPVVVSDDSWSIPGLNGFPGPYMKSMNHWFTPDDFVRLTRHLTDRRIYLNQFVAYQDEHETTVFSCDLSGTISKEPRGNYGDPAMKVVQMDIDEGKTLSEVFDQGTAHSTERLSKNGGDVWDVLAKWYADKIQV
jgi:inosine/xanthosine triphosphate pyrophosphatase family protein